MALLSTASRQSGVPGRKRPARTSRRCSASSSPALGKLLNLFKRFHDQKLSKRKAVQTAEQLFQDCTQLLDEGRLPGPRKVAKRQDEILKELPLSPAVLFETVRQCLRYNSPRGSDYFLELCGVLDLYMDCVITKNECVQAITPLFRLTPSGCHLQDRFWQALHEVEQALASRQRGRLHCSAFFRDAGMRSSSSYVWRQGPRLKQRRPTSVLNRDWATIPRKSEAAGRGLRGSSISDQVLQRVEDERYNLDMYIGWTRSLLSAIESRPAKEVLSTPVQLTALKLVYGKATPDILGQWKRFPARTLRQVAAKAQQKLDEYLQLKASNTSWDVRVQKHFAPALECKGMSLKRRDATLHTPTAFLEEAKRRYADTQAKFVHRHLSAAPSSVCDVLQPDWQPAQFKLEFPSRMMLFDVLRLLLQYLPEQNEALPADQFLRLLFEDILHIPLAEDLRQNQLNGQWGQPERDQLDYSRSIMDQWVLGITEVSPEVHLPAKVFFATERTRVRQPFTRFAPAAENAQVFYGTSSLYLFLRFLQLAYSQLEQLNEQAPYEIIPKLVRSKELSHTLPASERINSVRNTVKKLAHAFNALRQDSDVLRLLQIALSQPYETLQFAEVCSETAAGPLFRFHWASDVLNIHLVSEDIRSSLSQDSGVSLCNYSLSNTAFLEQLERYRQRSTAQKVMFANQLLVKLLKNKPSYVPSTEDFLFRLKSRAGRASNAKFSVRSLVMRSQGKFKRWLHVNRRLS